MSPGSPDPRAAVAPLRRALFGGWLVAMLVGFTFSALADRLIFVAWGLAAALAFSWALRRGFEAGRPLARGLAAAALGLAALAFLAGRHQESLDLGYRAFLPSLYHPWATLPGTHLALGSACALGALLTWWLSPFRKPS